MQAAKLDLPVCRYPSPVLKGEVKPVSGSRVLTDLDEDQLEVKLEGLLPGGCWRPLGCRARNGSVAVIIPSHGRRGQLLTLLLYLVPLLQRQQQDFCIYTGNQSRTSAGERFNKGAIVDALFTEAMKERNWTCVCIHDVDLIPENDYNSYSCPHTHVRNLMAGLSKWDYQLAYPQVFGGCTVSMSWHFRLYNGLSTVFWGWGSEDDDHRRRLTWAGLTWQRSALDVGRFTHIQHRQSATNPDRFALVPRAEQLQKTHGLNSLKYSVMHRQSRRLYSAFVFHLPNQGP
ncbi:beta-1,4-galactosyltransferase 3-like [Sycon ciliatum]|uniref:beta-1,4-galactosyltransferase 3-like n=1 Tax=Sycon ciliatum TaxID=27933 RepID=UPI0031F6BAE7